MTVTAILGLQWGDEGKGKIVDVLGDDTDYVVRCQGGANAGHTVVIGNEVFALHLLPSGAVRETIQCVIGNGVVLNPSRLLDEINSLEKRGVNIRERLHISNRAHLVLPYHMVIDGLREDRRGEGNLGTTRQGIGPAYGDKASRVGIRLHEALDKDKFAERLRSRIDAVNGLIRQLGGPVLDTDAMLEEVEAVVAPLRPMITDTVPLLHKALADGKNILLEGAQGAMLDLDFGTYPFLTSSNTTVGGCSTGSGIPPTRIDAVHGVLKAFTTRVGTGPFPCEVSGETEALLRGTGANQWDEFGTTTGRPRRVGWLDLVVARYTVQVNGVTDLHISKLDILSQFAELKICVAYEVDGQRVDNFPASLDELGECKPVFETLPGWNCSLDDCRTFADLPPAAQKYAEFVAAQTGTAIATVSFGPAREHTIHVGEAVAAIAR